MHFIYWSVLSLLMLHFYPWNCDKQWFTYLNAFLYLQFCDLYLTTSEQCCKTAREKLEVDGRLRQQQFGSQAETSSEGITLPVSKPSPRIPRKSDHRAVPTKGIYVSWWEFSCCWSSCSGLRSGWVLFLYFLSLVRILWTKMNFYCGSCVNVSVNIWPPCSNGLWLHLWSEALEFVRVNFIGFHVTQSRGKRVNECSDVAMQQIIYFLLRSEMEP